MAAYQNLASLPGGLLRNVTEGNIENPISEAAFSPAQTANISEPLAKTPQQGASQIVEGRPGISLQELQNLLQNTPPPNPKEAAKLIAALVSQPQVQAKPQANARPTYSKPVSRGRVLGAQTATAPIGGNTGFQNIIRILQGLAGLYGPANPSTGIIGGLRNLLPKGYKSV